MKLKILLICGLFFFVLVLFAQASSPATAALNEQQATPTRNPNLSIGNDTCLECHGKPGLTMTLDNGDILNLYVDPQMYGGSIHGEGGYACVQCHTTVGNYPHPKFTASDRRDASLKLYPACYRCHSGEYEKTQDSVHTTAMAAGNRNAAICTDCHTAHAVRQLTDPKTHQLLPDARVWIPQTCSQCHNTIYQEYSTSVHGSALIGEGNPDVPTCIDCHGVHNIGNPLTNAFRLNSPQLCAKCHTDPKIMAKYGISTQVLNTYVADFHGTTVEIFEKQSPDAPTNKPVCFDCHGVHDIVRVDDPKKGLDIEQNLLVRCKICHPDAAANFPTAWLSHYIPSPSHNSTVYYVGLFYKLLIPVVLGGMALLVAMDIGRSLLNRSRKNGTAPVTTTEEPEPLSETAQAQPETGEEQPVSQAPEEQPASQEPEQQPVSQEPDGQPVAQEPEEIPSSPVPEELPPAKVEAQPPTDDESPASDQLQTDETQPSTDRLPPDETSHTDELPATPASSNEEETDD